MTWRVDQQTGTKGSMLATGYKTTWCETEAEAVAHAKAVGTPARPAVAWDWEPQTPRPEAHAHVRAIASMAFLYVTEPPEAIDALIEAVTQPRRRPWRDWTEAATQRVLARLREVGA